MYGRVESVLEQTEDALPTPIMSESERTMKFERLLTRIAEMADINISVLTSGGRDRALVRTRQILCFVASKHPGISLTDLGRSLNVSKVAVLKSVEKGKAIMNEDNIDIANLLA